MRLFAIGDLHLAKSGDKPMDIFSSAWKDHAVRICENWAKTVLPDDVVLVPGDLSWAMKLNEAYDDLSDIMRLPGKKVFTRGNHDYWWNSISRVRDKFACFKDAYFLQNDSVTIDGIAFAGTRGWLCPQSSEFRKDTDEPIYKRELLRLELSLQRSEAGLPKVVLLHYPPVIDEQTSTGFTELLEKYHVSNVVYGHLHGYSANGAFEGVRNGVTYKLCSADHVNFSPVLILDN